MIFWLVLCWFCNLVLVPVFFLGGLVLVFADVCLCLVCFPGSLVCFYLWWLALVVAVVFTSVCLCLISCGVHVFVFGVHLYAVALVSMKCTAVAMVERLCGGKTSDS